VFVLAAMDTLPHTLAWAANIKYNASNHLKVTIVGACEHANYYPKFAARMISS
jgi:hypothetical protein